MDKLQRNERIGLLIKYLTDSPGKIFTLGSFTEMLGSAKSTICEDIGAIEELFKKYDLGIIETISGASGGIKYIPAISSERAAGIIDDLCIDMSRPERIVSGGFLYMLDVIYNPEKVDKIGRIFTSRFYKKDVDYVITVETKGIPLAFVTAKYLKVPLVIVRHYNEATDGTSFNINYVSGSSKRIQTMVLSLKALKRNSRLLFIDDFMKGGGTAKGIIELAKEFECEVAGIGVFIKTAEPAKKLVDGCFSILTLESVDEESNTIIVRPGEDKEQA